MIKEKNGMFRGENFGKGLPRSALSNVIEFKDSGRAIENKTLGGCLIECKEEERNGIKIGIIEGYIATWDLDRGNGWLQDQFVRGAFKKSIRDHKRRGRQVRLKDGHGRTVGGFPPETLKEDAKGLFGRGEVNLEVEQGRELWLMAKQGVLVDFSIGFSVVKSTRDEQKDIRTITEAIIWEGSVVDEPMNPEANITDVKSNEDDEMELVTEAEAKEFTKRDLEDALRDGREFSKSAAKLVASTLVEPETDGEKKTREDAEKKEIDDAAAAEIDTKNMGKAGAMLDGILEDLAGTD